VLLAVFFSLQTKDNIEKQHIRQFSFTCDLRVLKRYDGTLSLLNMPICQPDLNSPFVQYRKIIFSGHTLTYDLVDRSYIDYSAAWLILTGGITISALLFILFISRIKLLDNTRKLADKFVEDIKIQALDLRQSEARFRTVADYIYDWEYWQGENGEIRYMSPSCERITGYSQVEFEADPELLNRIILPDDRNIMFTHQQPAHDKSEFDFRIVRRDGSIRWLAHVCRSVYGPDSAYLGRRVSNRDDTARHLAEEELRHYRDSLEQKIEQRTSELVLARDAAEAANRAKSVFLSSMSHELRTPLNAILGFSSLMADDPMLSKSQHENLAIINRSGEHLLALINDVLEMARIEAGRIKLQNAPFDLGNMVRDVTEMMQIRASEKGLSLLIDQSSQFPRYITGDEARLRQVLINLIGNAIKFTRQGWVKVRLATNINKITHLVLEVADSGPGISQEDQQIIFQPFVQVGEKKNNQGTGLGLAISRQFVELMGGNISIKSTPGEGSIFMVSLPLYAATEAETARLTVVKQGNVSGILPGETKWRILIVEDQRENQLLLTRLMQDISMETQVAEDGEQALLIFQHWHPHLIWMDRRMPVMDGIEATKHIRALPDGRDVKIIAVTASGLLEQRGEMLSAGMDDFVRKPYRSSEIYECLSRHLDVQYTYRNTDKKAKPPLLTTSMLSNLPPALRRELHGALERLDVPRIIAAIDQLAPLDAALHQILSELAKNYDFPSIMKAIQINPVEDEI
jgi:PAS domain S-box-containing protein